MKKIIAVSAGLMLAGSIVASANAADITFSGDARARFNLEDNYVGLNGGAGVHSDGQAKNSSRDFWNSRVRLQFQINTKGGAYAVGRFRLADGTWNGGNILAGSTSNATTGPSGGGATYGSATDAGAKSNLWVDVGYLGVPMGPILLEGGVGYDDFTNDFLRAATTDNYTFLRAKYVTPHTANTTIYAFYEKLRADPMITLATDNDNQNDVDQYGVNWTQKFNKDWSLNGTILYRDDQQGIDGLGKDDASGVAVDALVSGNLPNDIKMWVELAYKQSDYQRAGYYTGNTTTFNPTGTNSAKDGWSNRSTTGDDGYGGYIAARFPLDHGFAISAMAGATFQGYTASPDFGGGNQADYAPFVMLSQPTSKNLGFLGTGVLLGSPDGNAYFVNVAPSVKPDDRLTLTLEGTYMNAEYGQGQVVNNYHWTGGVTSLSIWEVGGIASYKVTDGATVNALIGYLNIENADNNPFGFGLSLDLKF